MNIERFVEERSARWDSLENLLEDIEGRNEFDLDRKQLHQLLHLYREACTDLNRARSHTASPDILDRLNQLTGRAYRLIYRGSGEQRAWEAFRNLVLHEIPVTFRRERLYVAAAAMAFLFGTLLGFAAVILQPSNGERLIPAEFFTESPKERVDKVETGEERIDTLDKAAAFGANLYTHNIQVSFLAFSLGAITVIGAYFILFYNGLILGAVAAMYYLDGVQVFFFAWVGPHGALELPAIVFGAAAGIRFGHAFLLPGELTRGSSVRHAFPVVWRMLVAAALTLVLAGLIEGSFSQFSSKSFPYPVKILVSILLFLSLLTYLFLPRPSDEERLV